MKYLILYALFAAASASILPPAVIASTNPEVQEILASIQSPSTDPATAAALEQLLLEVLGIAKPEPIQVGPAIVDEYEPIHVGPAIVDEYEPIHVGPAIVPFPVPDGGALTVPDLPPLVHILIKVNQAVAGNPVVIETVNPPAPAPVHPGLVIERPDPSYDPDAVIVASPVIPVPV